MRIIIIAIVTCLCFFYTPSQGAILKSVVELLDNGDFVYNPYFVSGLRNFEYPGLVDSQQINYLIGATDLYSGERPVGLYVNKNWGVQKSPGGIFINEPGINFDQNSTDTTKNYSYSGGVWRTNIARCKYLSNVSLVWNVDNKNTHINRPLEESNSHSVEKQLEATVLAYPDKQKPFFYSVHYSLTNISNNHAKSEKSSAYSSVERINRSSKKSDNIIRLKACFKPRISYHEIMLTTKINSDVNRSADIYQTVYNETYQNTKEIGIGLAYHFESTLFSQKYLSLYYGIDCSGDLLVGNNTSYPVLKNYKKHFDKNGYATAGAHLPILIFMSVNEHLGFFTHHKFGYFYTYASFNTTQQQKLYSYLTSNEYGMKINVNKYELLAKIQQVNIASVEIRKFF